MIFYLRWALDLEIQNYKNFKILVIDNYSSDRTLDILKSYIDSIQNSVVHCFTGTKEELKVYLDMGCYIGITGWISDLNRGKHLHNLIKYIPEDRLMIETDSPYLIPHNIPFEHNGINEPSFLKFVAQSISECLNKDINVIKELTNKNTKRFFSI